MKENAKVFSFFIIMKSCATYNLVNSLEDCMTNYDIYKDIANRTNGDIYVGVVGPVRTGKSTFITKMLKTLVLPNILDKNAKERTIDEMPQSGDGKSIMTTQPKFIPNESVAVRLENDITFKVRLIDCVGYLVDGAIGHIENEKPRLVKTPWSSEDMPFEEAAELGTNKVITNHSTLGIMVTTDGSITDIPRENYVRSEERVINELKACKKPFVVLLNSTHPESPETINLAKGLSEKYSVGVLPLNIEKLSEDDINNIFAKLLSEFPITNVCVKLPDWMRVLPFDHPLIQVVYNSVNTALDGLEKIGDIMDDFVAMPENDDFEAITAKTVLMGEGKVVFDVTAKPGLFYRVLSEQCGCDITDEYHLVSYVKQLTVAKQQYDLFKNALEQVKATGYGVVYPSKADMKMEEPTVIKQGGKYGVRLKASAPSYHIMQVDIDTELSPIVGTEQQSEDLIKYLNNEFEANPTDMWQAKMFGKSLDTLISEGLQSKLIGMPVNAQNKMRKTLSRIVNEGKGGVICILL